MTAKDRSTKSDLRKVDQHTIAPEEYDEAPEFTDEMLARAEIREAGKIIRPHRSPHPGAAEPKSKPSRSR